MVSRGLRVVPVRVCLHDAPFLSLLIVSDSPFVWDVIHLLVAQRQSVLFWPIFRVFHVVIVRKVVDPPGVFFCKSLDGFVSLLASSLEELPSVGSPLALTVWVNVAVHPRRVGHVLQRWRLRDQRDVGLDLERRLGPRFFGGAVAFVAKHFAEDLPGTAACTFNLLRS